jgi:NADPH-dependent 2,4-dienoyl-CoA reductase/sulfur reductase-like enzyme
MATRNGEQHEVVVVGGGPAGLALATRLKAHGIKDVVVLEREQEAGGVPRDCGHWGFGWESHRRLMSGPQYAARLRDEAEQVDVRTGHTVLSFSAPGMMRVHSPATGIVQIAAKRIVLATGTRESTRAARLIGGSRLPQVMNTRTLQQLVYFKQMKPFARPVIIGGEWVSFSALMTCAHAGIRPAAMIVEEPSLAAPWFFGVGARLRYGVSVHKGTRLIAIQGVENVTGVEVETKGQRRVIACDGVIVSGKFVHEETLLAGGVAGPVMRAGNVQGTLKTAGRCVAEARQIADKIAKELR